MSKNIITEIKELIQQIKKEYREGVDFKIVLDGKNGHGFCLEIKTPQLKRFVREKFSIPILGKDYFLDYYQSDSNYNNLLYRIESIGKDRDADFLTAMRETELWNETENCKQCNQSVSQKEGWIQQWNGRKIGDGPTPNIIAHFHPECAKKYFADKEQANENNVRIKEKLLRNLDKLCFDPGSYLANNEYLKTDQAEEEYQKTFNLPYQRDWKNRYLKIVIDGEEISLYDWDNTCSEYYEVKRELIKKIKSEIKQNPSEWKIEKGKNENYGDKSLNQLVKHQPSGRRYWKIAINHYWGGSSSEIEKYWAEIEALINGSELPDKNNQPTELELKNLKKIFQEYDIWKATFENGKLTIKYDDNSTKKVVDDSNYKVLEKYFKDHDEKEIDRQRLGIDNTNSNSEKNKQNKNDTVIYISLAVGAFVLGGVFVYFLVRSKKKNR